MDTSHNHLREPDPCESSFLRAKRYLSDLSQPEKEVLLSNLGVGSGKVLVENLPDEEDLTQKMQGGHNVLKFKDKIFNPEMFSGMGKVFLRKNMAKDINRCHKPINILTLNMFEDKHGLPLVNTIFIVQYDYDLDKGFITIPENSILVFAGGSFRNGTVILRNTLILPAGLDIEHFMSVNIKGTYKEGSLVYLRKHLRLFNGENWINIGGAPDFSPQDKFELINLLKHYVNAALDIVSPFKITIIPEKNYIESGPHDIKVSWDYNRLINNQDIRLESGNKYKIYEELNKNVREYTFENIDAEDPVTIVVSTTYKGETISEAITLTDEQNPGLIIDDELSETSGNPVRNRAITRVINELEERISALEGDVETLESSIDGIEGNINTITNSINGIEDNIGSIQNRLNVLDNSKVNKEEGKGLSTNDFTNADKTKLDGIEAGAQKNPDLSGYATTASVNSAISSAVSGKQDKLPSGHDGQVLKWNNNSWQPGTDEKGSTDSIVLEIRKLSLNKNSNNIQLTYDGQSVGSSVVDEVGSAELTIIPNHFEQGEYEIASINGTKIYGKDTTGGTEGSSVSWNQYTSTGTRIAEITIDGVSTNVYAPTSGDPGDATSQFKEIVFKRSDNQPNSPEGGNYENPIPNGWYDAPPNGNQPLWFSTKTFSSDGSFINNWSTPALLADSEVFDVCYHSSDSKPAAPTSHGSQGIDLSTWHDEGTPNDKWMATSTKNNGEWSEWSIVKIKGERGDDGTSIRVVGSYDDSGHELSVSGNVVNGINNAHMSLPTGHTLTEGDCLTVSDGDLDGHIIYLSDPNPARWIDLGKITGSSEYLHIKFSNDGGVSFTPASEGYPAGETPGKYIGMYTDSNPVDSTNPNDYAPWILFKGNDGGGYWFLYTVNSGQKPASPGYSHVTPNEYRNGFTDDNGVTWVDEPRDLVKGEYEWKIWLRDSEESLHWSNVTLNNEGVSDGVNYNLVFSNLDPIYYDLNSNKLTSGTLSWNFYINGENKTNDYYYIVTTSSNPVDTDGNNQFIPGSNSNFKSVIIGVCENSSLSNIIYSEQYVFPTKGLNGEVSGTGLRVTLNPDFGYMACNLDGSSVSGASVLTEVNVYYNEQLVTATYNVNLVQQGYTALFTNNVLTVSSLDAGNSIQVDVPFTITYNGNTYSYTFVVIRDKDGNVYTLDVNPQVYTPTDALNGEAIIATIYKTYDRTTGSHEKVLILQLDYNTYGLKLQMGSGAPIATANARTLTSGDNSDIEISLYETVNGTNTLIASETVNYIATGTGAQGLQGCILRNCGGYDSNKYYQNDAYFVPSNPTDLRFIDYVIYNDEYYMVAPTLTGNGLRIVHNELPSDSSIYWIKATQMDFAYIKNLITDYIDSKTITTDELVIKRNDATAGTTTIVAGMTKGDASQQPKDNAIIWAGSSSLTGEQVDIKQSPFVVYEDGRLKATDAEISGTIIGRNIYNSFKEKWLLLETNPNPTTGEYEYYVVDDGEHRISNHGVFSILSIIDANENKDLPQTLVIHTPCGNAVDPNYAGTTYKPDDYKVNGGNFPTLKLELPTTGTILPGGFDFIGYRLRIYFPAFNKNGSGNTVSYPPVQVTLAKDILFDNRFTSYDVVNYVEGPNGAGVMMNSYIDLVAVPSGSSYEWKILDYKNMMLTNTH